jgi:hypothetical protein
MSNQDPPGGIDGETVTRPVMPEQDAQDGAEVPPGYWDALTRELKNSPEVSEDGDFEIEPAF